MDIKDTLEQIEELIKNMGAMQVALPKLPKPVAPVQAIAPSAAPQTTKDPLKVAQQIQDPSAKKVAVKQAKMIKFDKNGQWKLGEE